MIYAYLLGLLFAASSLARAATSAMPATPISPALTEPTKQKNAKKIAFNYENEDLESVINYVASQRDMNIVFPMKADDKITGKLTWSLDKKITLDEAWDLLLSILDIAGYCVTPKPELGYSQIEKNNEEVGRLPMPLFIGTPPDQLPQTEQQIRYIYYLANIKLEEGEGKESELGPVLKTLLPPNSSFKINPQSNSLLIMAPATDVRSIMLIVTQLDRPGFKEEIEAIELHYADARIVANLFKEKILQSSNPNKYGLDAKKASESSYFSKYVRLISYDRKNTLIAIGRPQALERVKDFITKYIDVKPDSGDSVLHTYQLQYLDAAPFAEVLRNIVQSKKSDAQGGPEQSTGEKKTSQGPERFFEDVIITIDRAKTDDQNQQQPQSSFGQAAPDQTTDQLPPAQYYGSNTLIIAARGDDWKRIKELIETLDRPQPQVLIEVLIADITASDARALGNMFRNPFNLPMPGQMSVQSAQLEPGVIASSFANPPPTDDTIGVIQPNGPSADLGRTYNVDGSTGQRSDPATGTTGNSNIYSQPIPGQKGYGEFLPGSMAISISDPKSQETWNITKIRKALTNTRILSHPHFISTNNQNAYIENTSIRLLPGDVKVGEGGAAIQEQVNVPASLKVSIRPQISIADVTTGRKNTVTLQVRIDINEFLTAESTSNTRTTRNVITNAIVNSGDVLALGGLLRNAETDAVNETPLLSKIPLLGNLFRNKDRVDGRTNLTVFISATVIEPRLRGGAGEYTRDYVTITKNMSKSNMFSSLRDPITRWFFNEDNESLTDKVTNNFMSRDEAHQNFSTPPMPVASTKKPTAAEFERMKKQNAAQIKDMMSDVAENPFKNINDPAKVRLRF